MSDDGKIENRVAEVGPVCRLSHHQRARSQLRRHSMFPDGDRILDVSSLGNPLPKKTDEAITDNFLWNLNLLFQTETIAYSSVELF